MATSLNRGYKIEYNGIEWVYEDNKTTIKNKRPCKRCNRLPTKEGHDACLGHIPNVKSACCGHGVSKPIMIMKGE